MIQFIRLDNRTDAALYVNNQCIATADVGFDGIGSLSNLESIAENLAAALNIPMQYIVEYPTPVYREDWSWSDIIESINAPSPADDSTPAHAQ